MRPVAALAVVTALLTVSACDGGSGRRATTSGGVAEAATVRTATCDMWKAAPVAQKWRLVRGMREFFGGHVDAPGERGQVLPNDQARRLFDAYCGQQFAGAFSLYRIYGNAAAFTIPQN
jgi:hypothetical protein